jgi:hypothetical protein
MVVRRVGIEWSSLREALLAFALATLISEGKLCIVGSLVSENRDRMKL